MQLYLQPLCWEESTWWTVVHVRRTTSHLGNAAVYLLSLCWEESTAHVTCSCARETTMPQQLSSNLNHPVQLHLHPLTFRGQQHMWRAVVCEKTPCHYKRCFESSCQHYLHPLMLTEISRVVYMRRTYHDSAVLKHPVIATLLTFFGVEKSRHMWQAVYKWENHETTAIFHF